MPFNFYKICGLVVMLVIGSVALSAQPECKGEDILAASACAGDGNSVEEQALFQLVLKYRAANSLPEIRLSRSLSMVANRHLLDLQQNVKKFTHSWSDCPYDITVEKTWPCINDSPKRLNSGYDGQGYETLYRTTTSKAKGQDALEAWKRSTLHNSIILNLGMFQNTPWNEVGVAIDGPYVCLWFGSPTSARIPKVSGLGLGVSYDEAVNGLTKAFAINATSTSVGESKWLGTSSDKTVKLELMGNKLELAQAKLDISVKLRNGKMSDQATSSLSTLMKNMFPEWPERDAWITSAVATVAADPTASRTKIIRKISVEVAGSGGGSFILSIAPSASPKYIEIF